MPSLDEALKRIEERGFPYENALVGERMKISTLIGKLLIIRREWIDGRITVILVRELIGA